MRKYTEFEKEAGPCPEEIYKLYEWLAYKDGQCQIFDTRNEAESFSKLTESRCKNESEVSDRTWKRKHHIQGIHDAWYNELRSSFSSIPDAVFTLFYQQACRMDDEYGPDSDTIAENITDLVEFFNNVYSTWELGK